MLFIPSILYADIVKYIEIDCGTDPCKRDYIAVCDAICRTEIHHSYDANFRVLWFSTKHSWDLGMEPFEPSTYNHIWSKPNWGKSARPAGIVIIDPLPEDDPTLFEIPGDTNERDLINDIKEEELLSIVIADLPPIKTGGFIDLGIGPEWNWIPNPKFDDKTIVPIPSSLLLIIISFLFLLLYRRFRNEIRS